MRALYGWWLVFGFVPDVEKPFYSDLVYYALEVIELEEEPKKDENPTPPTDEKEVVPLKGKGKGKRDVFIQVFICFFTKPSVQRKTALTTIIVKSPTAILFAPALDHISATSHYGTTIHSVPRKKKAVASDSSTTSSENLSSLYLIENVDMGELIEDLMRTKFLPPAYHRIQDLFIKVWVALFCFFHSFYGFPQLFVHYFFFFAQ